MTDCPDDVVQRLERAGAIADAAVAMLGRYPEEYRVPVLVSLLAAASDGAAAMHTPSAAPDAGSRADGTAHGERKNQPAALGTVAAIAGVDRADLERIVHLEDDSFVKLLLRVDGRSVADRASRAATVYCFIKEHAFGDRDVGIEELRRLCVDQQAYNAPNFTRNLQDSSWLLAIGEPRSRHKKYRLSPQGEEAAKVILKELLDV